uniref:Uncharacterized protein n=1 Tax=viral metagenome TaxID=1070528 RepID=A0A6M3KUQ2_9ZZZZ
MSIHWIILEQTCYSIDEKVWNKIQRNTGRFFMGDNKAKNELYRLVTMGQIYTTWEPILESRINEYSTD